MRIISGKFKGQQLVSFQADHIRPTTDRVKETIFNKIQFEIAGSRILDLFCGTGNLGLEALSREAIHCTFVESNAKSLQITRSNIQKFKVEESDYRIINQDVIRFLKTYKGDPFDIIFADPPFTKKMADEVMMAASQSAVFGSKTILAIESQAKEKMLAEYPPIQRFDFKEYGDKVLSFFRLNEEAAVRAAELE
jgi:16S rRNA (guanine966-N2)-methyltransferase